MMTSRHTLRFVSQSVTTRQGRILLCQRRSSSFSGEHFSYFHRHANTRLYLRAVHESHDTVASSGFELLRETCRDTLHLRLRCPITQSVYRTVRLTFTFSQKRQPSIGSVTVLNHGHVQRGRSLCLQMRATTPNNSLEPTAVGACSTAIANCVASRRRLSYLR
jgi:hypothetical protein